MFKTLENNNKGVQTHMYSIRQIKILHTFLRNAIYLFLHCVKFSKSIWNIISNSTFLRTRHVHIQLDDDTFLYFIMNKLKSELYFVNSQNSSSARLAFARHNHERLTDSNTAINFIRSDTPNLKSPTATWPRAKLLNFIQYDRMQQAGYK